APVVELSRRTVLTVELEHRQQLHRGNAELLEIRDLLDQAGERAARRLSDPGTRVASEAADVHLVNDGAGGRLAQRDVCLPIVSARIDDNALRRRRSVVAFSLRSLAAVIFWERPCPDRTGSAGPWRSRTAVRARGPLVPPPGSHRSAPAAHQAQTR